MPKAQFFKQSPLLCKFLKKEKQDIFSEMVKYKTDYPSPDRYKIDRNLGSKNKNRFGKLPRVTMVQEIMKNAKKPGTSPGPGAYKMKNKRKAISVFKCKEKRDLGFIVEAEAVGEEAPPLITYSEKVVLSNPKACDFKKFAKERETTIKKKSDGSCPGQYED